MRPYKNYTEDFLKDTIADLELVIQGHHGVCTRDGGGADPFYSQVYNGMGLEGVNQHGLKTVVYQMQHELRERDSAERDFIQSEIDAVQRIRDAIDAWSQKTPDRSPNGTFDAYMGAWVPSGTFDYDVRLGNLILELKERLAK